LVNDLLDVGAIASGNFSVDLSRDIDIGDVLKRAMRINHDYALKRNVSLKLEISDDVKLMKLDEKRMKQVLTNLISNAVKYSPKQSEVKIICRNVAPHPLLASSKPNPEFLEILVIDQGFGMNEEQIKTAFEKYQTIQNPNSGTVDSFGLGLPITKQLVELQNGSLEVKSELEVGTKIKLKFPYLM
jgi:signal transduction histidine kinase